MLFSLNYKSSLKQQADEIRCPINQLGSIFNFIKDNPDKRYNIIIADSSSIDTTKLVEQVEFVKRVADDYTIECGDIALVRSLINGGFNAYLRFPVPEWETFSNLKDIGVSDIYIDGPIGFQCDALKKAHNNIKIRVSPTVSANGSLGIGSNIESFFIRPEDLHLYSDVIDIIDFKVIDPEKENALFNIYKRGTFNFNLEDLVEHLNVRVPNLFIKTSFGQDRLNCGMRCVDPSRGQCHLCDTEIFLTNTLYKYIEQSN